MEKGTMSVFRAFMFLMGWESWPPGIHIPDVRLFFMLRAHSRRATILTESLQREIKEYVQLHFVVQTHFYNLVWVDLGEKHSTEPVEIITREEFDRCIAEKRRVSFGSLLLLLIDERGEKESDVYRRAYVDRRVFSRICCDKRYHPGRWTVIRLALVLSLDRGAFDELMQTAGYALSNSELSDLLIAFCIERKIYDLFDIDSILTRYETYYKKHSIFYRKQDQTFPDQPTKNYIPDEDFVRCRALTVISFKSEEEHG